jgi:hypothetical protein
MLLIGYQACDTQKRSAFVRISGQNAVLHCFDMVFTALHGWLMVLECGNDWCELRKCLLGTA